MNERASESMSYPTASSPSVPHRAAGSFGVGRPVPGADGAFVPIQVVTVDVAEPLPELDRLTARSGVPYGGARVLVLLHDMPIGVVWLQFAGASIPPERLAGAIWRELGGRLRIHAAADAIDLEPGDLEPGDLQSGEPERGGAALVPGLAGTCTVVTPPTTGRASVVLATRGRPASLPVAIDSILASDHPEFEVVVVDNSPDDRRTAALIAERYAGDRRVRLVAEPRPGLSYARNRGLAAVEGDVVAFTDDDVAVRPTWLRRLTAEFADPAVTCVTGLVEPVELESLWQWWFECAAGFGRGTDRRVYHLIASPDPSPLFPYQLGSYGTGASMALRRSALPRGWAFDEALGAGSPAAGGEDLDLFLDVLTLRGTLVYQPAALAYHRHRADRTGLRSQMRGYGRGLTALLAKRMLTRPDERAMLLRKAVAGVRHALSPQFRTGSEEAVAAAPYPRALRLQETVGMIQGPATYLIGVRRARRRRQGLRR